MHLRPAAALLLFFVFLPLRAEEPTITIKKPGVAFPPELARAKVAFIANKSSHKEVYTCNGDGSQLQQLTRDGVISVGPALSADGRKLAYTGYQSGYADIYLVDLTSGSRNRIIKYPGTNSGPAISPQGNRIACTMSKDGNPEIYVTNINGDSPRRLT